MHEIIVVGGNHHNTLGVIRSLGEKGLRPILIVVTSEKKPFVGYSKYLKQVIQIPNDSLITGVLLSRCKSEGEKAVVICCSDASSGEVDGNSEKLIPFFHLPGTDEQGRVSFLMNKKEMLNLAVEVGMKIPQTICGTEITDKPNIPLPCIIKPLVSMKGLKTDIHICRSWDDVIRYSREIGVDNIQIQRFVDKDFEYQLIGCATERDIVIPGVSKILRPCKGSNTSYLHYVPMTDDFCEIEKCVEFVKKTGYKGLFSLEFIRDKEGKDNFLEMNFRNDGNAICVTEGGVNLPYIWYCACTGQDYLEEMNKSIKPSYVMPDLAELKLLFTRQISIADYFKDLRKTDRFMEYDKKDPKPFWRMVKSKMHL